MNIFKILSSNDGRIDEPNISSFFSYLLNPNEDHGLSFLLLQELLKEFELTINMSNYEFNIQPEFRVKNSNKKSRDIDILVEILLKGKLIYSICIENKINDASIIKKDNQLKEEMEGLKEYYKENNLNPEIYVIYITHQPSKTAEDSFKKLLYQNKTHLYWKNDKDNKSISNKLIKILDDEKNGIIDPINEQSLFLIKSFVSFIKTDFKSQKEEIKEKRERTNYGKPIIDYLNEYIKSLSKDKEYEINQIEDGIFNYVKKQSGLDLHIETKKAQVRLSIVNEQNRVHFGVKSSDGERKNLFYYSDKTKNIIKLYDKVENNDIPVYYKDIEF